ncbi:LOB domain-containing protein 4-like [Lycium barbarum]|uniref:LOB domain-containing protein 4-like n=1 Tax=Lycium barbarum TaxID=112863 RepID=UPI00293E071D|nr:LOB domain-containing protein 4-like [Lycium barbarum]
MKENGGRGSTSPCAACKLLRRRCTQECVFAPYFPGDEPQKFASVHKVFGASNVSKMLQELPEYQRGDAVSSMVYEANARIKDPVYGCVGTISSLQQQVDFLQTQLAISQAELVHMKMQQFSSMSGGGTAVNSPENVSPPSSRYSQSSTTNSLFTMDMVVDQANIGAPLWSC